ncbi:MAG: PSD1 domain-containing protein [Planctomycetales bacterium]|nr:PSD1 domain-containing protein [Planctomycetales bacterium]
MDFRSQVRPILSNKCVFCHGPDAEERQAELRLDTADGLQADLGGYQAVQPGEPERSAIIERITSIDPDVQMPPPDSGKSLSASEIEVIKRWISEGAKWSDHWAYVRPSRTTPPSPGRGDWSLNWIDDFVLARLETEGLQPAPEADRVTLIRRLSFDLTGLPPKPEEVDEFVADKDPQAYEKLVDRLIASERYGERMAVYWLDLVRFADTVGYHGDQDHNISPYRDYVIDAFNDNMPLDQFTREQLAGDLLPGSTTVQKIASGYNRLLQTSHEGGVQPKEYLAIYAADRVRNLSEVWLGATMGCCQCHDHKFDPLTTRDFYSMAAFFADLDEAQHFSKGGNSLPTNRPPEEKLLTERERQQLTELEAQVVGLEDELVTHSESDPVTRELLEKKLTQLREQATSVRESARVTMISVAIEPRTMRVLPRGNWLDDSGEVVLPAVPAHFGPLDLGERRATRLDLANWLTDPERGVGQLTGRVFANRFWYLFFGLGISKVLDDFGGQGEPPVHPELLDNLALEFVESGWDVKHMVKLLVMSRTYRQQSLMSDELLNRDPYNRLVARQSRYRLPAEMVRDSALSISGLLVLDYGGASAKPYQPAGYYRHLNFPTRTYEMHSDRRQWRRGVYVHWQRQFLHPMLKAFDAPQREECTAERPRSNTPLAALVLLNDPTFVESARAFAERIVQEGGESTDARLQYAFRLAVSRAPDQRETELLGELLMSNQRQYEADPTAAAQLTSVGLKPVAEGVNVVELAAWTSVARAILNMSETITRN